MSTKLELVNAVYSDNEISIETEHTSFSRRKRIEFPDMSVLEKEVKSLRKELQEANVKLKRTDTLKLLKENKVEYNELVNVYNDTFTRLAQNWKYKIEIEGFDSNLSNDDYYINNLRKLEFELQKMNYRNTITSKVMEIKSLVKEIKEDLLEGVNYISVSI